MVSATVTTEPDAPAVTADEAPRVYAPTARAALDAAKDRRESADGLYDLYIPSWGYWVQLKRADFATLTQAVQSADGDVMQSTRNLLRHAFVQPAFSPKEVDEILNDADQLEAALLLNEAIGRINNLTEVMRRVQAATFRPRQ